MTRFRRKRLLERGALALGFAAPLWHGANAARALPQVGPTTPAIAVRYAPCAFTPVSISGRGFGTPADTSTLRVQMRTTSGGLQEFPINSKAACDLSDSADQCDPSDMHCIVDWTDERVVVNLDGDLEQVALSVATSTGTSPWTSGHRFYQLETFDVCGYGVGNGLAVGPEGHVWINGEFHVSLALRDANDGAVKPIPSYPVPPMPGPYYGCITNPMTMVTTCGQTTSASFGETATIDTFGRAWLSEGGMEPIGPLGLPHHSRIIMVDPSDWSLRLYNIPGNRNGITGVAWDWDGANGTVWFSQTANSGSPTRLTSFDPDGIPHNDFGFDWLPDPATEYCLTLGGDFGVCGNVTTHSCESTHDCVLAEQICVPPDVTNCYREYTLEGFGESIVQTGRVAVHPDDGSIWFANYYFGSSIGRLDPASGAVTYYPVSAGPDKLPAWPWDVKIAPPDQSNPSKPRDILLGGFFGGKIGRFDYQRLDDSACRTLVSNPPGNSCAPYPAKPGDPPLLRDPSCHNPCISEFQVPGSFVAVPMGCGVKWERRFGVFTLVPDSLGNLWFDRGYIAGGAQSTAALSWANVRSFPPIARLFPNESCPNVDQNANPGVRGPITAGITTVELAIDPTDGSIWAGDYFQRRLIHLTRQ